MSHVARLSVITKTKSETCAWKTHYLDGVLVEGKPGQTAEPKPCAGNDGTTIIIEDNTPTRLAALRSASEEYSRILDVMTKYAVVSFVCKKVGSSTPDLSTPSSSEVTQAIRLLYGHSIAKDLLHTKFGPKDSDDGDVEMDEDNPESWSAEAHFTNPNYQSKKMIFLLFINHRLVESPRIKRALENVYNSILPKARLPFLQINPRDVDVNVHPTKEVHFLNEESITDQISNRLQRALAAQSQPRMFEYQTLLTGGIADPDVSLSKKRKGKERARDEDAAESAIAFHRKKLRLSTKSGHPFKTAHSMFPVLNPTQIQNGESSSASSTPRPPREIKESDCILSSVKTLRQAVAKGKHKQLSEILEKHTFVGIVDLHKCLSLMQHATKLYLVNHVAIRLIEIAVELEETTEESGLTKPEIVETLISRRDMLAEYFSFQITPTGKIESLPLLLREYTPNLDKLPAFLMRLGPQVDWTSEKECFETFLRELAYFYVPGPLCAEDPAAEDGESQAQDKAERWQIQHIVFPALRPVLCGAKDIVGSGMSLIPLTPLEDYELALDGLKAGYVLPGPTLIAHALCCHVPRLLGATSLDDLQLSADELKLDMPTTTNPMAPLLSLLPYPELLGATSLDDLQLSEDELKLDMPATTNTFALSALLSDGFLVRHSLDDFQLAADESKLASHLLWTPSWRRIEPRYAVFYPFNDD
ncbi:hypothetical protein C8F01DRAFT_1256472 [Mycena amicta]|nr:hypothetical protein C8F01DRAFT_1256472 [Mycena amicta]